MHKASSIDLFILMSYVLNLNSNLYTAILQQLVLTLCLYLGEQN